MFRRGDEFFGSIDSLPRVGGEGPRLTLSAYGDGPRPKISGYKIVERPESWHRHDHGVWKVDLTDVSTHAGNTTNSSPNAGFIVVDGVIHGDKKWNVNELDKLWDFYNDTRYLYIRSDENPAVAAKSLRVAVRGSLIVGQSRLRVAGLDLTGSGGHGYRQIDARDTEVVDCHIGPVGGSQLEGTTRYGNGVEIWMGSSDSLIHKNEISDVYDAATTLQGAQDETNIGISRCHIVANTISNCTQSFEYWVVGSINVVGAGIVGCSFSDNLCVGGGHGWGYSARPDKMGKGNFLMAYHQEAPIGIDVRGNVFFDARDCYTFVNTNGFRFRDGFVSDFNTIALRPGTQVQAQLGYTIENAANWAAETHQDTNSRWMHVPVSVETSTDALTYVTKHLVSLRGR
jgi:hypothetical protein